MLEHIFFSLWIIFHHLCTKQTCHNVRSEYLICSDTQMRIFINYGFHRSVFSVVLPVPRNISIHLKVSEWVNILWSLPQGNVSTKPIEHSIATKMPFRIGVIFLAFCVHTWEMSRHRNHYYINLTNEPSTREPWMSAPERRLLYFFVLEQSPPTSIQPTLAYRYRYIIKIEKPFSIYFTASNVVFQSHCR